MVHSLERIPSADLTARRELGRVPTSPSTARLASAPRSEDLSTSSPRWAGASERTSRLHRPGRTTRLHRAGCFRGPAVCAAQRSRLLVMREPSATSASCRIASCTTLSIPTFASFSSATASASKQDDGARSIRPAARLVSVQTFPRCRVRDFTHYSAVREMLLGSARELAARFPRVGGALLAQRQLHLAIDDN